MKRHLNPEDKQVLDMLDANSKGKYKEPHACMHIKYCTCMHFFLGAGISLLQEIQDLLVHSESHLKDNIAKYMQVQLQLYDD